MFDALRTRRSIAKLEGPLEPRDLEAVLGAALLAPNHHLTEPWTFTVVRGAARERLGRRWAEIVASQLEPDGAGREARIEAESRKLMRAPVAVVASVRTDPDPVVAFEDAAATAAAVENMLLAAAGLGLGAIWRTGEMAYSEEMNEALGLERTDRVVAIVYLGLPAADPKPRPARRTAVRYLDS